MERKGQMTLFVILAIVLVGIILLFFLLKGNILPTPGGGSPEENPTGFLESCVEPKIVEAVGIILSQGGYIENKLSINFKFEAEEKAVNISYLCYNQNYYLPCINQEPMLIQHIKDEIKNYIADDVENCVNDLKRSYESAGYDVNLDYRDFEVELVPKKVLVIVNADLTASKSGESNSKENFYFSVPSRIYDLSVVAQEIVSQEARFCNFEQLGFMLFYPNFDIDKFRTGNSDTIYTLKNRDTKEMFRFAVRSCVIPPGF